MGYMTTITFLNDAWSTIVDNKEEFINEIERGMNGSEYGQRTGKVITSHGVGNHCNPLQVAQSHHADMFRLYLVGQNSMSILGHYNNSDSLDSRKRALKIAKQMIKKEEQYIKEIELEKENLEKNKE